jgi:threonyl-tRNA synthetase
MNVPDHRRLGRQLKFFATDDACGSGLPFWLPAGAIVRSEIERFIVDLERRYGYLHVYTPEMGKRELYERSGHWAHYHDDMYPPMDVGTEQVVLRPMNCPHHILVYRSEPRSLREIPFRLAELGTMFRYERSGVVGGLSRVRQMTLNDGHVFCAGEHVEEEIASILELVDLAYKALAIPAPTLRLSRKGDGPKYATDPHVWARSEELIRSTLVSLGLEYVEAEGEAAFYGPKIDLQVVDPQGREETLSTVQLDFVLPERFDLSFRRGTGQARPVIVHRSIV